MDYNFAVAPNLPVPQYTSANLINGTLYATSHPATFRCNCPTVPATAP